MIQVLQACSFCRCVGVAWWKDQSFGMVLTKTKTNNNYTVQVLELKPDISLSFCIIELHYCPENIKNTSVCHSVALRGKFLHYSERGQNDLIFYL